ncbi:PadR family transcriptional regulator [Qipengyuania sp. CAU 1752]
MNGWPFIAMMAASQSGSWSGSGADAAWGGWDGSTMHRGRRRRRGRMFGPGELRLVLLKLVADEPRHGYELIKAIEDMTDGAYSPSPGTIYPTLSLLQDEGAIAEASGNESRKAYEVTASGRGELDDRSDEVAALIERLTAYGRRSASEGTPHELFRAAGNLANVLKYKFKAGELDEKARREIVDMIDEVARKIERL